MAAALVGTGNGVRIESSDCEREPTGPGFVGYARRRTSSPGAEARRPSGYVPPQVMAVIYSATGSYLLGLFCSPRPPWAPFG